MKQISLPIEQDGEEESDHHDCRSDHGDPSACDERIENDAGDRQASGPFSNGNGEKKKF